MKHICGPIHSVLVAGSRERPITTDYYKVEPSDVGTTLMPYCEYATRQQYLTHQGSKPVEYVFKDSDVGRTLSIDQGKAEPYWAAWVYVD